MWVADHETEILARLRLVTKSDFYDKNGKKIYPKVFYIKRFHGDIVEEHVPHANYDWRRWREWVVNKSFFVEKQEPDLGS